MNFKRSVTTSYENNVLCKVCQFKKKRSQLKMRWDGLWVCDECWESRHPTDFYRNRSDVHLLPFVYSDDGADPETTWVVQLTNHLSLNLVDSETSNIVANQVTSGYYYVDPLLGKTRANFSILFSKTDNEGYTYVVAEPLSLTTSGVASTVSLPTTAGGAGSMTVLNNYGKILGSNPIAAGDTNVALIQWLKVRGHVHFSALYGT